MRKIYKVIKYTKMDPTEKLCRLVNDKVRDRPTQKQLLNSLYPFYISQNEINNTEIIQSISTITIPNNQSNGSDGKDVTSVSLEPIYVDLKMYQELQQIKDLYDNPNFAKARLEANPFERIGKSIFMDRAGVKLANIDAIFDISGHIGGYIAKQTAGSFTFCDLAGGPGAWTQYLQYRRPEAYGYGITLRNTDQALPWNTANLDMDRFNITYGKDNTGDLYTNANWFAEYVKKTEPEGVDLVVADGGFGVEGSESCQEILTSRLILSEALTGVKCLKVGGNFVCKVYDTVSEISAHVLFIMALCFENIWLFKPISSRPANCEKYLICKGRRNDIDEYIFILSQAYNKYHRDRKYDTIVSKLIEQIPNNFSEWLTNINNVLLRSQYNTGKIILNLMSGNPVYIPKYNTYKCLIVWNLPDNENKKSKHQTQNKNRIPINRSRITQFSISNL